ncbi:hypothetical protein ATO5_11025 [Loktanella sp. 22II-4b]|nr:hypothetical protein [Brevirhabdus pacifica]OWU76755.1 hypothetical protein ATO5_11025 [Loktanella sp. 22II-4b]PJJ86203.1 hypothetical protein CLV77_0738 [Brevirhabdus pacifica]
MTMLIDTMILALLAGTLAYAFLVDRRVRRLMSVLHELQPMVGEFSAAVDKSQSSVAALRDATRDLSPAEPARVRTAPQSPARVPSQQAGQNGGPTSAQPAVRAAKPAATRDDAPAESRGQGSAEGAEPSEGEAAAAVFSSRRAAERPSFGASRVTDKADMVRGFFDAIRAREA